jgi:hypothetical protein
MSFVGFRLLVYGHWYFFRRVTRLDEMRYWFIELLGMNHNDDDYPSSPAISLGFPLALRFTFSIC